MSNDKTGFVDQAKGEVKDRVGGATGDKGMQAEGMMDKAAGKIKEKANDVKEKSKDVADDVKDRLNK